jgi:hypothetical protein
MISLHNYAGSKQSLYAIMKLLIFALLAKARHVIESVKDSHLVAVRHTIDQFSRVVITLNMYKLQHNLLYKSALQI